ncbi:MAG TPA: spermidine/putrescine ABC transporter substrate-binding protein [Thermoanaerobaculia bacterium]|nr:spermidine/putrescine ABC transporter substrate-binding protein [Thermoanaerobaculia bacterium]
MKLWVLMALLFVAGCGSPDAPKQRQLNVYIWTNYLPQGVVADFEKRTGIAVRVDTYDSNETILAKLQSGVAEYDLVVPSDYMLKVMIPQKLLRELDRARLSGIANLDPRFLDQRFDPGNRHSIPYLWGTTGIGYDTTKVAAPIDSWGALFDPRHAGRILMLDDVREAFGAALKLMGRSINETDPAILRQAAERLKQQKRLVRTYNSSDFANLLAAGDVDVAQGWNGELAEAVAASNGKLAYVVPKEGGTLWIDSLAVPATAKNVDSAYAFLQYVLEPEIAARIVNGVHYAGANQAALEKVEPTIRNDPAIYPPQEVLDRCEFIEDLGETTELLDELWTEVKAN